MSSPVHSSIPSRTFPGELRVRRRLVSRLAGFIVLEFAFIALAVTCLFYQLPCSISSSPTLTKATFTVLFIAWHTFAIMCAQELISHVFSGEWFFRLRKRKKLRPGYTDVVSTITSGFRDRLLHSIRRSATLEYRLSYLAFWVLFALSGIAPSSINVDDLQYFAPTTFPITNFSATGGDTDGILKEPIVRTGHIIDLELQQNTSFKFGIEERVIVGWPDVEAGQLMGDMVYPSDALLYNMSCWWEAPTFNMTRWNTTAYAGGFAWYPWTTPDPATFFIGGLMPMFRFSPDQDFVLDHFPLPLPAVDPVGLSGYLFYGQNSSFARIHSRTRTFSLDGLPTIYNDSGFHFIDFDRGDGHFMSPLASFLICDPRARIADGQVLLNRANTTLTVQSAVPVHGEPNVGNISPDAGNVVLGLSMMDALEIDDEDVRVRVGGLASQVFLNDTTLNFERSRSNPFDMGILPLEEIQRNLNQVMQSGSKSLSSYIRDYDDDTPEELFIVAVRGAIQKDKLVLVGSQGFVIVTICLVFTATFVMAVNILFFRIWNTPTFKLQTLIHISLENDTSQNLSSEKADPDRPHALGRHALPHLEIRTPLLRLFGFLVLEVAFLSLVLVCSRTPIIVDLPLPLTEVKGSFAVFFRLWQGSAIFLLSDAVSHAYSCEWSLQQRRTIRLVPDETDRVSRLSSGNMDKIQYFFSRRASTAFRLAFTTFAILTALNSFAPGTLSIGPVKIAINTTLDIADLSLVTSSQGRDNDNNSGFLQIRAAILTLLEHHEGFNFRYDVEPNWIMAWPNEMSLSRDVVGIVEYPTDVIRFNYSCVWAKPEMGSDNGATTWLIDGQAWELWSDPLTNFPYRGGILTLYRYLDVQPDDRLAVVVLGTNDSLSVDPPDDKRSILNLNNLPTLYHPSGLMLNNSDADPSQWISPLSTVLYCDPHIDVSGGRARLSPQKSLRLAASGLPPIGNIPRDAITTLFTSALLEVLDTDDDTDDKWLGVLSEQMFLQDASLNFSKYPSGVPLYDLATLNDNFNSFTLSASKAFLDGLYANPKNQSDLTAQTRSVVGTGEVEMNALTGDKTLGIVSLCLSIASVFSYGLLVRWSLISGGKTFVLANLLPVISAEKKESFVLLE